MKIKTVKEISEEKIIISESKKNIERIYKKHKKVFDILKDK